MGLATIIRKEKVRLGERRILILGLDNAGKSTVLSKWLQDPAEEAPRISPTFGFEIKSKQVQSEGVLGIPSGSAAASFRLNFWDIGGQKSIRPFWRNYFEETDAVVWVVDSTDADRFAMCCGELESVLHADRLAGASVLILANKQDCNGAQPLAAIRAALGLDALEERGFKHRWAVFGTSAVSGTNLAESLAWLVKSLQPK